MANSKNITFDQLQAGLSRVKSALDGKANTSHGNHVPKTETANNARFLRNDNTWQTITPVNIGAADRSHSHGSYLNQNAFSNIKVGDTTVAADSPTDTLTLTAGANVTLTPDATNDTVTIAAKDTVYTHPTTSGYKHIPSGGSSGQILRWSADGTAAWGSDNNTDTKVTNTLATTTKAYVTGTTSATTNTGTQVFDTGVYLDTTAGKLVATTFAGSLSGNATSATKLQTGRKINDIAFDGTADKTIPLKTFGSYVGDNNTKNYHRILSSGNVTGQFQDKSITLMASGDFNGGAYGIVRIILRTNASTSGSTGKIEWIARKGFGLDSIVFNIKSTAGATIMDVFYKSPGTYSCVTWTVLGEGGRDGRNGGSGGYGATWTKYNTHAVEVETYTADTMKTIASYTSTMVQGTDVAHVNTSNTSAQLSTARTINGTSFNGTGNITTANWGTARTLTIGNSGKSVNGSGNVSWSLSEIGAAASGHTHNKIQDDCYNTITIDQTNDCCGLDGKNNINIATWYGFSISNNCSNYDNYGQVTFSVDARSGQVWTRGTINAPTFSGSLSGNASSATKLATARAIKIGNTSRNFDGTGNVTWTLGDIGALPAAGGTVSGNLNVSGTFSIGGKKITINSSAPSSPAVGDIWIKI